MYRLFCGAILLAAEALVFLWIWNRFYNPYFRAPYLFKGRAFVTCLYVAIQLFISRNYGGLKLGYYRSFNIIFSMLVTAAISNVASYFAVIIPAATRYLSPVPAFIYMTALDAVLIFVWGMIANGMFYRIFPPQKLLLIAEKGTDALEAKFALRMDRYEILKSITPEEAGAVRNTQKTESASGHGSGDSDDFAEAMKVCLDPAYDGVIVGDIPAEQRNDILKYCYAHGVRTYTVPKITDVLLKSSETMNIFDSPIFLNRNRGLDFEQAFVKRASDIVMSLIGLIIALPFFLVIAIAIKLEDHGPVFFKQRRCTQGGKEFEILKFRSMIVDAEASGITVPATERDPRITKVGRVIRATRLDELPQLINILKGEMSVVGPRPERIEHVRQYTEDIPEFSYRMMVKGGLTGYAQVYGKYNTSAYDKLKLDLLYIENYSIILDMEIILRTIQVLFTKESTEGFEAGRSREMSGRAAGKNT